ncbi:lactonase family protein [Pseudomonas sp. MUP55]|uniref:lactonase family protein n=1 Tax=Pseudomonas sp. MUP55 TaxID=3087234 RepID=UPI002A5A7C32|nr:MULTISPECIES: lactonase family protein [unclassified Pseudomonas]WPN94676.1 lactonase family protein [Pseudomonas sp. MUP56]WPO00203.1 lactonase family protein [Pseudomonas sp. MUP55]
MRTPLLLAAAAACGLSLQANAATFAYISSPGDGLISQYRLDQDTGALRLIEQVNAGDQVNPMAITPDGKVLFAALRVKPFQVLGYNIDPTSGHLTLQSKAPLAESMAYLSTDRKGHYLLGASYGADTLSVQAIDKAYTPSASILSYKTGLHAHSIRTDPSNRFAYAGNLGVDRVLQYRLDADTGALTPIGSGYIQVQDNTGPRHLAFSPDGKYLYVVGEMSGTVTAFSINASTGALTQIAVANGIPERLKLAHGEVRDARNNDLKDDPTPRIWAADLRISPDGTLLLMTERTSSSVSAFAVDPSTGGLSFLANYPVQEQQPRNIAFSPNARWLLVTGEKSDKVGTYAVSHNGALKRVGEAASGKGALWIEVLQTSGD